MNEFQRLIAYLKILYHNLKMCIRDSSCVTYSRRWKNHERTCPLHKKQALCGMAYHYRLRFM